MLDRKPKTKKRLQLAHEAVNLFSQWCKQAASIHIDVRPCCLLSSYLISRKCQRGNIMAVYNTVAFLVAILVDEKDEGNSVLHEYNEYN